MAFRFVIGRAGCGKTTCCLQEIKQRLADQPDGRPLIWLVPEQATFQAEYALISDPQLGGTMRAQVLSFRRLAWRVMQEVGGTARLPIDEIGKKLLLHRILHRSRGKLKRFDGSADQSGFIDNLSELINEFKRYNIPSADLAGYYMAKYASSAEAGSTAAEKLHDLQLVYAEFEVELSRLYLDGEDYLTLLARQLGESSYVRGAEVWVDGFHGFTPQELSVLEQIALHAGEVTLTLSLDRPYARGEQPYELDLFHPTARTMLQLQELLFTAGVETAEPRVLEASPPRRFAAQPQLAYFEARWQDRIKKPYESGRRGAEHQSLRITAAASRRAEVEALARDIISLVRDQGLRWKDIAVSVRSMEAYCDVIAGTFDDFGIPHFFDSKRTILHHPLVELIRSSLETGLTHWKYDPVFRCVKTGFFAGASRGQAQKGDRSEAVMDIHALDQLENYVLAFGIQGSRWTEGRDWGYSYRVSLEGDEQEARAADEAFLTRINETRRMVAAPLLALHTKQRAASSVRERVGALYAFLEEMRVPERLESWSQKALHEGQPEKARLHGQVWERVMDMFDQLVELMGEESVTLETFAGLLETGLESIRLGLVPPTLDQVLIGSMDRTRTGGIKHMFVIGVTEGILPAKPVESGLLTEAERELLAAGGLVTAEGARRRLLDESFMIYTVFCTPSEGLWLSYPLSDEEGKSLLPSDVIRHMKRMFPDVRERFILMDPDNGAEMAEHLSYVAHPDRALSLLGVKLKEWMKGTPMHVVWWSVYNWFARQPEYAGKLARMRKSLLYTNEAEALSEVTSRQLYGDHIETSVSRMERFVACPFSQFASHGLRLKERRIHRLEAPDVGQLFHAALSQFLEDAEREGLDWNDLTSDESERRAAQVVDALAPKLQGEILLSSQRYQYIARKLKQVVGRAAVMLGEHAKRGRFQPVGLEVAFGKGQDIPPLEFELNNGVQMELRGRIDRIDRADTAGGTLLRVIDYKSSAKSLSLSEVYHGLSLQMLTYLDVILTHAPIWLGHEAEPAGVLYFHVHNPILNARNALTADEVDKEFKKRFKTRGLLKADADIIGMMDSRMVGGTGHSELIPAALKGDGSFYKTSSVASDAQWDTIRGYVRRTIGEIGTAMTDGRIDIQPYRMGQAAACSTCSYRPVCQFDPQFQGNEYKQLAPIGKDLAWELMARKNERTAEPKIIRHFRAAAVKRRMAVAAWEEAAAGRAPVDEVAVDQGQEPDEAEENAGAAELQQEEDSQ